ncbi:MAG: hypothetical protein K0U34_03695 [Alphaproteobacteria bacterium]|nr:hypothetical protein [Alphaproteobacteria bacterium]
MLYQSDVLPASLPLQFPKSRTPAATRSRNARPVSPNTTQDITRDFAGHTSIDPVTAPSPFCNPSLGGW